MHEGLHFRRITSEIRCSLQSSRLFEGLYGFSMPWNYNHGCQLQRGAYNISLESSSTPRSPAYAVHSRCQCASYSSRTIGTSRYDGFHGKAWSRDPSRTQHRASSLVFSVAPVRLLGPTAPL